MDGGDFERDDAKAAANLVKHGVSFGMAREALKDPFVLEWEDDGQDAGERRLAALGMAEQRILFVAYTLRENAVRIISARKALPFERRRYADDNQA